MSEIQGRKVVQLSISVYQGIALVALCDDGSMWFNERPHDRHAKMPWIRIADIAEDGPNEKAK